MSEPIEEKFRKDMNDLARAIDEFFNGPKKGKDRDTGFVLLVFPFGAADGGRMNYISNGDRGDIVVALKELIARFEGQPEVRGTA